jgi:hypothetical protein
MLGSQTTPLQKPKKTQTNKIKNAIKKQAGSWAQ